jgi:hypothetical protein
VCGAFGAIDIDSFDGLVVGTIIPALAAQGVNTTTLPIFLLNNVGNVSSAPEPNL